MNIILKFIVVLYRAVNSLHFLQSNLLMQEMIIKLKFGTTSYIGACLLFSAILIISVLCNFIMSILG